MPFRYERIQNADRLYSKRSVCLWSHNQMIPINHCSSCSFTFSKFNSSKYGHVAVFLFGLHVIISFHCYITNQLFHHWLHVYEISLIEEGNDYTFKGHKNDISVKFILKTNGTCECTIQKNPLNVFMHCNFHHLQSTWRGEKFLITILIAIFNSYNN